MSSPTAICTALAKTTIKARALAQPLEYQATALGWAEFFCRDELAALIRERGGRN